MAIGPLSSNVEQAMSVRYQEFRGQVSAGDANLDTSMLAMFKALRLDEVSKEMRVERERGQRLLFKSF